MDKKTEVDQNPQEKFARSEEIIPGSDGWLSPSGVFFKAGKDQHKEAADWIVNNNLSELKEKERVSISDAQYMEKSGLPSIPFLREKGWILINGPIFRTDNALNYTTNQLTKLSEAGIPIVGAYDGSKEFSSQETLDWVKKAVTSISDFIERQELQVLVPFPDGGYEPKKANQTEFWENIKNRGFSTLEDFGKDPFHTIFGHFGLLRFTDVRDVLTNGYQDEMIFDHGQETYMFRLVKLNSGERICVEYTFHHHDRDYGNEEHMHAYVVDNFTFEEKIKKYISSGVKPQIKGQYFERLLESK